jgi:hypothetical protein
MPAWLSTGSPDRLGSGSCRISGGRRRPAVGLPVGCAA